jgi:hypothetical protein
MKFYDYSDSKPKVNSDIILFLDDEFTPFLLTVIDNGDLVNTLDSSLFNINLEDYDVRYTYVEDLNKLAFS